LPEDDIRQGIAVYTLKRPMKAGGKILTVLFLLLLSVFQVKAQYFIIGQEPASIKWNQIKTGDYRIIYPSGYGEMAQYYINLLRLTQLSVDTPYVSRIRRTTVILHNHTVISNAVVPIAPIRVELFEMPSQDMYPQLWQDQLALHEFRHIVQMNKLQQGLTKGLYYVFGQQAIAFVMGLWVPFWFIEGDAVYSETVYSHSGRGRVPEFIYPLKAQVLDRKIYKYDKAVFGSFRDFVPDYYTLGYQLVGRGIEEHGTEMWNFTLNRVARRPYYLIPFTTAVKKQTGMFKVQYYNHVLKSLKTSWWIDDQPDQDATIVVVSPENRFYTSYLFPQQLKNGAIIAEKTGLDDVNRFVLIDTSGKEKILFTPGYDFHESLSVSGSKICWNEKAYDPRWDLQTYSVIKLYDLKTGKKIQLTHKSRYFAPALSPDGKEIVTVHVDNQSKYSLHILDAETGEVLKTITAGNNLFFLTPHWSDDGKYIVTVVLGKNGKNILKINTETREQQMMLSFSYKEIKWPVMHGKWIVFTGTFEGKDILYAIDSETGKMFRVFEPRFGAIGVSFAKDGSQLLFSYYTADGFKIATLDFDPGKLQPVRPKQLHYTYLADRIAPPDAFNLDDTMVPEKIYPVKKYSKAAHLFNLHSWTPLSVDADNYSVNPGVTLMSQNMLSTAVTSLSYLYDVNEETHKVQFGFDYLGWYPVISFKADYGGRKTTYHTDEGDDIQLKWKETNLSLNISVPLNLTSSKWVKGLEPSVGVEQKFLKMDKDLPYEFREDKFTSPVYQLFAYNQHKMSQKDLYPKWGQIINLIYRHTPWSDSVSSQLAVIGYLYFPGFIRHQGLKIYGGYQKTFTGLYSYSDLVAVPRGYSNLDYPEFFTLRTDYAFPLAYPDWNVPGAFYLKRIYAKVFYDYMRGIEPDRKDNLSSTGAELYTDWNFLSIMLNVKLGCRITYRMPQENWDVEFLIGVSPF